VEGLKKSEKKGISSIELSALVIALVSAVDAAPAQALEVEPSTSWFNGVGQNVRGSVLTDTVERSVAYAQYADGTGEWLQPTTGESSGVTVNVSALQKQAHKSSKVVSKICILHTHPIENYRAQQDRIPIPLERVPASPGEEDIASVHSLKRKLPAGMNTFSFGAADGRGVWYYSGWKTGDKKIDDKKFDAAYGDFMLKSITKDFNFDAELPKLQQAYRHYLNGEIRFVPYEQIKNEPPCAGVHVPRNAMRATHSSDSLQYIKGE